MGTIIPGIEFVMVAPLVVVIEVVLVFGAKIDIAAVTVRLDSSLIIKFHILKTHLAWADFKIKIE